MTGAMLVKFDKPRSMTLGTYRELEYDAVLVLDGLNWYRVKGGFGERDDREDWVADVPGTSVSVSRKADGRWGPFKGDDTKEEAMRTEVGHHLRWVEDDITKAKAKLAEHRVAKARLQAAASGVCDE